MIFFSLFLALFASGGELQPYSNKALTAVETMYEMAYPMDYVSARKRFREYSEDLKAKVPDVQTGNQRIHSKFDNDLTIDYTYIPYNKSAKLFVITSGVHGPEGYTGSLLQYVLLKNMAANPEGFPYNVLIIHSVNPYGYKYFRRANEQNVDLNRNFATREEFKSQNKSYYRLRRLFHPKGAANSSWIAQGQFYLSALWKHLRKGKKVILEGLSGQYIDPTGPFYGGDTTQLETQYVQNLMMKYGAFSSHIYLIDLHTGYGEKGKLHFFGSEQAIQSQNMEAYKTIFKDMKIDTALDKDFYPTTGDMVDWVWKNFSGKKVVAMAFEFGTMDSQTLKGGLFSLWTSTLENQGFHNGYLSPQDEIQVRANYEALFNPQDYRWQVSIVAQAIDTMNTTMNRFKDL